MVTDWGSKFAKNQFQCPIIVLVLIKRCEFRSKLQKLNLEYLF